jgi:Transposase DDE domain/Domain of unknown function (DUF4372)
VEINIMRHENSVFHQITKQVPWSVFDRLVDTHKADFRVRRLSAKSQFLALLFGQLSGASSLREIETGLNSHRSRLYHLGAKPAARSTLADANANRSWQVFADLFAHMAHTSNRTTRRKLGDGLRILDATKIGLSGLSDSWARFSDDLTAAKLHIVYDPDAAVPLRADITPYNVNDITPAKALPLEAGATYVFDLAYYDYGWWAKMDALGCRFVTRLKSHTWLRNRHERTISEGGNILSDCTGKLSARLKRHRKNPMQSDVREISVRIDTGKIIRLTTNDLTSPAEEIADIYKARWQIELFFKWIKQNLKIKHFLGTSDNAVRIQLFVALIAYLLLKAAHAAQNNIHRPVTFVRLVRLNLMHRRPINALNKPHIPPPINPNQMTMRLGKC